MTHDPDDPKYKFYDAAIKEYAIHKNKTDDLVKHIADCLRQDRVKEALQLAENHTNNQKYKGVGNVI